MSFNNRKFSMNRHEGVPRLSKQQRRFTMSEPSANGTFVCLLFCLFLCGLFGDGRDRDQVSGLWQIGYEMAEAAGILRGWWNRGEVADASIERWTSTIYGLSAWQKLYQLAALLEDQVATGRWSRQTWTLHHLNPRPY